MTDLHPMLVHLPLALALVWWGIDGLGLALGRPGLGEAGALLLGLAIPAALAATVSGQAAFDRAISAGVAPELLADHADRAGAMPWALLGLLGVRLGLPRRWPRLGRGLALALGVGLAWFAVEVGRSGGALVFESGVGVRAPGEQVGR